MLILSCLTLLQDTLFYSALYPILSTMVAEEQVYLFLMSYALGFILGTITFYKLPFSYIVMSASILLLQMRNIPNLVFFCILLQGYSSGMNWLTLYLIPDFTKTGFALGFYHLGTIIGPFLGDYILYLLVGNVLLFFLSLYYKPESISSKCLVELLDDPHIIHASILLFIQLFMFNGMLPVIAFHLNYLKKDSHTTSLYFMSPSIPNIVLSTLSGYLVDRYNQKTVILMGLFFNIGSAALFYDQLLVGMLSIAASYGWILTTVPSLLSSSRLPTYIWYNVVIGIASFTTPLLSLVYYKYKLRGVAFVYLFCACLMFTVHLIFWHRGKKKESKRQII